MKLMKVAGLVGLASLIACAVAPEAPRDGTKRSALEGIPADALLPDIVEEAPKHFGIQNQQQREWMRFSSTHWNKGAGPLQIRGANQVAPCDLMESDQLVHYDQCTHASQELLNAKSEVVFTASAGIAVFHPAHNHWHQNDVADFVLRAGSLDGPIVAKATKITYCLIDLDKADSVQRNSERTYWDCNGDVQGISPGWGDEYHHSTSGQEIEVTGIPAGIYYLTHEADPANHWIEANDTNNGAWAKIRLDRQSNASIAVLDQLSEDCTCTTERNKQVCTGMGCGNTANK